MKKLSINGVIGWDVTSKDFIANLDALNGEDFELDIHSPGGSVFEGLAIYNALKAYKGKVDVKISGLAASMASVIALAKGKPKAAKSSVYMIHNAQNFAMGDYREMEKMAKLLDSVSGVLAGIYSDVTGKSKKSIREMMDNETYMFGQEGVDNGFIESLYDDENTDSQNDAVAMAQLELEDCIAKMKNYKEDQTLVAKMVALADENKVKNTIPIVQNKTEEKRMTLDELKAQHPEVYAHAISEGMKKERAFVSAHLKVAAKIGAYDVAAKFIAEGKSFVDEEVQSEYLALKLTSDDIKARKEDNVVDKTDASGSKESDDKAFEAELKNLMGAK